MGKEKKAEIGKVMKVIANQGVLPIKTWTDILDDGTDEQAGHLAQLPFAFHHIALMPDTHVGYGMPIGGVLATIGTIVPYAVGVDIGCGMRAWDTQFPVDYFQPIMDKVMRQILRDIPVGMRHHKTRQSMQLYWEKEPQGILNAPVFEREFDKAHYQLGTLGSGNHFIEAQACEETGTIWFMIHSGSRNVGKQVCDYHHKVAVTLNGKYHSKVPKAWNLAFLPLDSQEGQDYVNDMQASLAFAKANRAHMEKKIRDILYQFEIPDGGVAVDIHHNYAAMEHWHGKNVMVHRKGAVRAKGTVLIPGNMGTLSYVAEGLDNPESFGSCSHGAGRIMSRTEARHNETIRATLDSMETKLYAHGDVYDEAPGAYKDIRNVMVEQSDLVCTTHILKPLAVVKG